MELAKDERVLFSVAPVDVHLHSSMGTARYKIKDNAANTGTRTNPPLNAGRYILKEGALPSHRADNFGPELASDLVAVLFFCHSLNLVTRFIGDTDHKFFDIFGRD